MDTDTVSEKALKLAALFLQKDMPNLYRLLRCISQNVCLMSDKARATLLVQSIFRITHRYCPLPLKKQL